MKWYSSPFKISISKEYDILYLARNISYLKKSRIQETLNLSTNEDDSTNTIFFLFLLAVEIFFWRVYKKKGGGDFYFLNIFFGGKKKFLRGSKGPIRSIKKTTSDGANKHTHTHTNRDRHCNSMTESAQ